jgi:hypothetical protein
VSGFRVCERCWGKVGDAWTVLEAPSVSEALYQCREFHGPIQLLISDVALKEARADELAMGALPVVDEPWIDVMIRVPVAVGGRKLARRSFSISIRPYTPPRNPTDWPDASDFRPTAPLRYRDSPTSGAGQ